VGFAASVGAHFCDGSLCGIQVLTRDPGNEGWKKQFFHVRDALARLHGPPASVETVVPDACASALPPCLSAGNAAFRATWSWSSGRSISLSVGAIEGQATLRVSYERPPGPAL
jgi:hypothetical protein